MKPRSQGFRWPWLLAAALAAAVPHVGPVLTATGAPKPGTRAWNQAMAPVGPNGSPADVPPVDTPSTDRPTPMVKLNYLQAPWSKVLNDLARSANLELVADRLPEKPFTRWDNKMHEVEEAIRILNRDLERQGLRLLKKENHLVVIEIREARREYPAYVYTKDEQEEKAAAESSVVQAQAEVPAKKNRGTQVETLTPRTSKNQAQAPTQDKAPRRLAKKNAGPIRQVAAEDSGDEPEASPAPESKPTQTTVRMKARDARAIANIIHKAFKAQAETLEEGPRGLPGFRVRHLVAPGPRKGAGAVRFSIGIDDEDNRLVVEAAPQEAKAILKMIRMFDVSPDANERTRLVPTKKDPGKIAATLQPELDRLAAETRKFQKRARLANQRRAVDPEEENPDMADEAEGMERGDEEGFAVGLGGRTLTLKGEVRIEEIPGVGLVIFGNKEDVETVIAVINEIERLSAAAIPQVEFLSLRHANSEALAALLTSVYEKVAPPRARAVGQQAAVSPVSIMPIIRPNAILIIAPESDVEAVVKLALELDQPGDPNMDFKVFRLKNAICAQVVETVDAMYGGGTTTAGGTQPGGTPAAGQAAQQATGVTLAPRVRIISDTRTNSVIVQARPRDMREVALLILELDEKDPETVDEIRLFPLSNSVADELAYTLGLAIQSVLQPPRLTGPAGQGQFGQQPQQQAGTQGQVNPDLREVRSSILEFVYSSDGAERVLRSGILADIRITSDTRTNTLVVSAPKQSMDLLAGLIELLDQPTSAVAEIKVFILKESDATATVNLLQQLFNVQGGGQRAGQQQGQFGQNVQGLLVQGAEDASSTLVPLRFVADARTNSITAIGGTEALGVVEAILLKIDASSRKTRVNEVYRLKNSPAADVAAAVSQFLQTQQQAGVQIDPALVSPFEQFEREVIVVAEPVSNSLLVSATPRYIEDIMDLIKTVDRQPQQVLIQALLVEVTLDNTDEWGVEIGVQDSILFDRSPVTSFGQIPTVITQPNGNNITNQTVVSQVSEPGFLFNNTNPLGNNTLPANTNPSQVGGQGLSNFAVGRLNSDLGYGGLVLSASSENISVLLRALAARRRVDVLSRPQVLTLDNNLAQVQVGQEIPRVNNFTLNNTTGQATPIIQFRPIGIILRVTPRITPEGMVVMAVAAYKDALSQQAGLPLFTNPNGSVITAPIVDTTNAQATVSVRSGQTVVLGGMITNTHEVTERKVPIVGDIPLVGQLFRYDFKRTRRTELLIFLTPRIVHDEAEAEMFKEIEAQRINFIECEAEAVHGPLFGIPAEDHWIAPGGVKKQDDGKSKPPSSGTTIPPGMSPDSRPPSRYVPGRPTPMPPVPNQEDDGPALMQDLEDDDDESLILPTTFKTPVTRIGKGSYKGEPDEATSGATKPGGKSSAGKKKKK